MPLFSTVMVTRNRPALFRHACSPCLTKLPGYRDHRRQRWQQQRTSARIARNSGAAGATAPYICFLDDDDTWTDPNHLDRAHAVITEAGEPVDLYLTNQAAFLHDKPLPGPIWIEDLPPILAALGNRPHRYGTHVVTTEELLRSQGFCHLNTLIVLRALYHEIGGLDESNGWEHDRDLYLRLIDRASVMIYAPVTIARHNVPDPAKATSVTTTHSEFERHLSQLRLLDRAIFFGRHAAIRAYGRRHKAYTLKRIAESLAAAGRHADAVFYAREALGAGPTTKWAAYTAWRTLKQALARS